MTGATGKEKLAQMTKVHRPFDVRLVTVFMQAARDRSFTRAGERLNMTPSAVSKAISRLEEDLGAVLLRRNPRSVFLTPAGVRFLEEAERLTLAVERARSVVADRASATRRRLRVALPLALGRIEVAPQLPLFVERFPNVDFEYLLISNGQLDPLEHEVDVGLWVGGVPFADARYVCDSVADVDAVLCASPAYLEQFGWPESVAALDAHRTLGAIDETTKRIMPWRFHSGGQTISHQPRFGFVSNSIEVLLSLAVAGSGILHTPFYLAADHIRQNRLQLVLPDLRPEAVRVQIVYARSRAADPEVTAFLELLIEVLERQRSGAGRLPRPVPPPSPG